MFLGKTAFVFLYFPTKLSGRTVGLCISKITFLLSCIIWRFSGPKFFPYKFILHPGLVVSKMRDQSKFCCSIRFTKTPSVFPSPDDGWFISFPPFTLTKKSNGHSLLQSLSTAFSLFFLASRLV